MEAPGSLRGYVRVLQPDDARAAIVKQVPPSSQRHVEVGLALKRSSAARGSAYEPLQEWQWTCYHLLFLNGEYRSKPCCKIVFALPRIQRCFRRPQSTQNSLELKARKHLNQVPKLVIFSRKQIHVSHIWLFHECHILQINKKSYQFVSVISSALKLWKTLRKNNPNAKPFLSHDQTFLHSESIPFSSHPPIRFRRRGLLAMVGIQVIRVLCRLILRYQVGHDLTRLIKLVEVFGKRRRLLIPLHEGVAFAHAIVLFDYAFEQLHDKQKH